MTQPDLEQLKRVRSVLANIYPTAADARRVASDAGLDTGTVNMTGSPVNIWFELLKFAVNNDKYQQLLEVAREENPGVEQIRLAIQNAPAPVIEGPLTDWKAPASQSQLEKIMGAQSTLVPIAFLEQGLICSRSVARVRLADGSTGSGFLIAGNLLVTNHHVLPDENAARQATAQFNYQRTLAGTDAPIDEQALLPDMKFLTSAKDDWTVVQVAGNPAAKWGTLPLNPVGKLKQGDHVNIIQHPGGAQKQISFKANVVMFVGEGRVQYLTDTLPGSSGSPVFDTDWNVVALHHSGGWLVEPNARSKTTFYRNEGILIDVVLAGIA